MHITDVQQTNDFKEYIITTDEGRILLKRAISVIMTGIQITE